MANVNVRVDDAVKDGAERIFSELGLTISAATNVFYKQVIRSGGMPFELLVDPFYSVGNQKHLEKAIAAYESGKSKPVIKSLADLEKMADE
ncbi:MAG: type II toxin-antitoxin system RelB/DinJ family antitoxin [Deferribacteraceae bacterium]|jgi:DNA-damage-inducible protein J|nr:type II toxin-antitoxin system RelB/DinJ family antitoxin [Deferribacteraceae bacterium]